MCSNVNVSITYNNNLKSRYNSYRFNMINIPLLKCDNAYKIWENPELLKLCNFNSFVQIIENEKDFNVMYLFTFAILGIKIDKVYL